MHLSSELFKRMISHDSGRVHAGIKKDRRRAPRMPANLQATLMPFSDQFAFGNIEAPIRDLSRGGFCFLHDRRLPLGEHFALLLPESLGRPLVILCTVAYWQPIDEGFFAIGAKFCRVLRAAQDGLPLLLEDVDLGKTTGSGAAS